MTTAGIRLKSLRETRGWSQADVAKRIGVVCERHHDERQVHDNHARTICRSADEVSSQRRKPADETLTQIMSRNFCDKSQ